MLSRYKSGTKSNKFVPHTLVFCFFKILLSKKSAISAVIIFISLTINKIKTALSIEKVPKKCRESAEKCR